MNNDGRVLVTTAAARARSRASAARPVVPAPGCETMVVRVCEMHIRVIQVRTAMAPGAVAAARCAAPASERY